MEFTRGTTDARRSISTAKITRSENSEKKSYFIRVTLSELCLPIKHFQELYICERSTALLRAIIADALVKEFANGCFW